MVDRLVWRRPQPFQALDQVSGVVHRLFGYRQVTTVSAPLADVMRGVVMVIDLDDEWQRWRPWWKIWRRDG